MRLTVKLLASLQQQQTCSEYEQSNHLGNVLNTVTDHLIRDYNLLANEDMAEQDPFTLNTRYMTASKALSAGALVVSASTSTATASLGGLQLPGNPIQTPTTPYQVTAPKSTLSYTLPIQAQEKYSVNFDLTVNGNPLNQVAINVEINGVQIATTTHTGANGNKELVFTANNTGTATVRIELFPLHQVGLNNATQTVTYTIGQTGTYNIDNLIIKEYLNGGFVADVQDANLYYPFGSLQPGRHYTTGESHRYGLNGMEMDSDVKGLGNHYTTFWRQYDPRLGRWMSTDPMEADYAWQSPYAAFNNSPLYFIDPTGAEGEEPPEEEKKEITSKTVTAVKQAAKQSAETTFNDWVGGNVSQEDENVNNKTSVESTINIKKDNSPYTTDTRAYQDDVSLIDGEPIYAHVLYYPSPTNNTIVDVDIIPKPLAFFDGGGTALSGPSLRFNVSSETNSRVSANYFFTDKREFSKFVKQYNTLKRRHLLEVAGEYDRENGTSYRDYWKRYYDGNNMSY